MKMLEIAKGFPISLGKTSFSKIDFNLSAYDLQGITVIVGKKGTGKSHLAKAALLGLIDHEAKAIVFDVNDEYSGMILQPDGKTPSKYHDKIIVLEPEMRVPTGNISLKFTLQYVGLDVFYSVLVETLGLPDPSAHTVRNIWETLANLRQLSFSRIRDVARTQDAKFERLLQRFVTQFLWT